MADVPQPARTILRSTAGEEDNRQALPPLVNVTLIRSGGKVLSKFCEETTKYQQSSERTGMWWV